MKKRNLKLVLTFAVVLVAVLVFFSIESFTISSELSTPNVNQEKTVFNETAMTGASGVDTFSTEDKAQAEIEEQREAQISQGITLSQILKYISLIITAVFLVFAGYQILSQRAPEDLLSNNLRMNMLVELREADKIPTYFSTKYDRSKSTISEHLDKLVSAGLVERIQNKGKKFVYYRITREGKNKLRDKNAA